MKIEKTKVKTMRLELGLIQKVEERAKQENRNFTNMVETILKKGAIICTLCLIGSWIDRGLSKVFYINFKNIKLCQEE